VGIDEIGRRLIGAAASDTLAGLRDEVTRLATLNAQQEEKIDALQAEIATLREGLEQVRQDAEFDRLSALAEKNGEAVDALNTRLKAISEQMRWDRDEIHKAVAALAERIERKAIARPGDL
jgi:chromosome segregation ATPase